MILKSIISVNCPPESIIYKFEKFLKPKCFNCNASNDIEIYNLNQKVHFFGCNFCNINIGLWYDYKKFCIIKKNEAWIEFSIENQINILNDYHILKSIECKSSEEMINYLENINNLFVIYKKLIILK